MAYLRQINTRQTPQSEPVLGRSDMAKNNADGFVFTVDDWKRLDRFCVLGSEGGTYYVGERELTRQNAEAVVRCIQADGIRAVRAIRDISVAGRAPKNDPALFALALAMTVGDVETRRLAQEVLVSTADLEGIARIGTHLLHFAGYSKGLRGTGRLWRKAVRGWFNSQDAEALAYQAIKYRQRDGWALRDLLRLSHAVPRTDAYNAIFHWITQSWEGIGDEPHPDAALRTIWAFERAQRATTAAEVLPLIRDYNLPREALPTELLKDAAVWEALLERMPMEAMVRNLATMTRVGLLAPMSEATATVVARLGDGERIRKARLHPIKVLAALKTYAQGHGERSGATWNPVASIVDGLDGAFYLSFENVEPTNQRFLLALDVSGSMGGGVIAGMPGMTPRVASAALALITAATEPQHAFVAFTSGNSPSMWSGRGYTQYGAGITPLTISPRQRLDDVVQAVSNLPFGGTDCALPMLWATEHKMKVDCFVIYTDNETWAGNIHPFQALRQYREAMGIPAKLIVVGMTATEFTIADPNDAGTLDVVGFDTSVPEVMSSFVRE